MIKGHCFSPIWYLRKLIPQSKVKWTDYYSRTVSESVRKSLYSWHGLLKEKLHTEELGSIPTRSRVSASPIFEENNNIIRWYILQRCFFENLQKPKKFEITNALWSILKKSHNWIIPIRICIFITDIIMKTKTKWPNKEQLSAWEYNNMKEKTWMRTYWKHNPSN